MEVNVSKKMIEKLLAELLDTEEYRAKHNLEGLEKGQTPEVYTLFCGDSRVEASAVTTDPLNKLFGNEVIGNQILGIMGSAAYPTEHLHSVKLVNVMGHVSCGAVTAAYNMSQKMKANATASSSIKEAINYTLESISGMQRPLIVLDAEKAIEAELHPMAQFFANARSVIGEDEAPFYVKHSAANVILQTMLLMRMPHIKEKVEKGEMLVTGTLYDFVGKLGKKGMIYLIDVNGTAEVSTAGEILRNYKNNMLSAASLLKQ